MGGDNDAEGASVDRWAQAGVGRRRASGCKTGFTLLELLVVISIISMLMSIMLPSLKQAKEQARQVVCLSNIRQVTAAWFGYTVDCDDRLCSPATEFNDAAIWGQLAIPPYNHWVADGPGMPFNAMCGTEQALEEGALWSYLEVAKVYKCESDRMGFIRSYAMNHAMGDARESCGEKNYTSFGEIRTPSQRLVLVDAKLSPVRDPGGWMHGVGPEGSFEPIDTHSMRWLPQAELVTARHNRGCMMSFADLHMEQWRWRDERTLACAAGEMDWASASEGNKDIERLMPLVKGVQYRQQ